MSALGWKAAIAYRRGLRQLGSMKLIPILLMFGGTFLVQSCSPEKPQTRLSDLQGSYSAQGCEGFTIVGSRIVSKELSRPFKIERIKGRDYLVPDGGVVVDEADCRLVSFHFAELIPVTNTGGQESLDILGLSQGTSTRFSKTQRGQ